MKYTADGSFKLKSTLLPIVIIVETSKIALTYSFCSKAVVSGFKKKRRTQSFCREVIGVGQVSLQRRAYYLHTLRE